MNLGIKAPSVSKAAIAGTVGVFRQVALGGNAHRATHRAVWAGISAARAACGGRLPKGVKDVLSMHLFELTEQISARRNDRTLRESSGVLMCGWNPTTMPLQDPLRVRDNEAST